MFEKILKKLRNLVSHNEIIASIQSSDPIAMQTKWTPKSNHGATFQTHKLVEIDFNRVEFRATIGAKLFYLLFIIIGLGLLIAFFTHQFSVESTSFTMHDDLPLFIGTAFTGFGSCMLYFGTLPIVFDKYKGLFWKGLKIRESKHFVEFEHIHALQLISKYHQSKKSAYYSYELNLILQDASRINVVTHGSQQKLREDAEVLSSFLGKPVWNAI